MDKLYPWLQSNFNNLSSSLKSSPHHAYLINAPEGVGKLNLVNNVVKYYLCDNFNNALVACDTCSSCQLINAGNHPDIHYINDKEGEKVNAYIKIDQIRKLSQTLATTPQIAKTKIVILTPADKLNTQAANSFLKTLEEPQGDSLLFLLSSKPYSMPATILSRCLKMPVNDIDDSKAVDWLSQFSQDSQSAKDIYRVCNKSPIKASEFLKNNLEEKRNTCFDIFEKICLKKENLGALANWTAKQKISTTIVLSWLDSWISDLCKISLGVEDTNLLINNDITDKLINIYKIGAIKNCFKQQQRVSKILAMDKTSLNEKVLLTDLLANIVMN